MLAEILFRNMTSYKNCSEADRRRVARRQEDKLWEQAYHERARKPHSLLELGQIVGLDLQLIDMLLQIAQKACEVMEADRFGFDLSLESQRCLYVPTDRDLCPGRISPCPHCHGPEDCFAFGGSTFCVSFLRSRRKSVLKSFSFKKNVTEKENSKATKSMDERERLFDLLLHDLTDPLSIIATSATSLLQKSDRYGPLTFQQKRVMEHILRNVHKAQTLLQEMIEIFHSEEGLFHKEDFLIGKVLRESIVDVLEIAAPSVAEKASHIENEEEFKHFLKSHEIFLEITGSYCQSPFSHDQKKIQQILRNLMSNALKYRSKRMRVSIGGETDLQILVEDDGQGIPQIDQESVFQGFIQLHGRKRSDIPGLGLGLTGVKTLVEAMGGEITLESHEDFGTRFMVRIPPLH